MKIGDPLSAQNVEHVGGDLQEAADEAVAQAHSEGAFGTSATRYLEAATAGAKLPEGAELRVVRVKYHGWVLSLI